MRNYLSIGLATVGLFALIACSNDDDLPVNDGGQETPVVGDQYVVIANDTKNSYMMTTDDISDGKISPQNTENKQVLGTPSWYFYEDVAAYSFIYRKGDPGTTQSFVLGENNALKSRNEIDLSVSMQTIASIDDYIYLGYSSRNYEEPEATYYKINPHTQTVEGPLVIDTKALANFEDTQEIAYTTDIAGYKDYILVGYRTIMAGAQGESHSTFDSNYDNITRVAVFDKNFNLVKIIKDSGRTGVVAGQRRGGARTGIEPVENGDVYVFSSALNLPEVPSGVLKINNGTLEFDQNYFFNISEASGGFKVFRSYYVGNNTFVLRMFSEKNIASASPSDLRRKFAVVNVADETFTWVTGVPTNILSIGTPYIDKADNKVVFPMETSGYPTLYLVDAEMATMTAGVEVIAEGIDAVGKLSVTP